MFVIVKFVKNERTGKKLPVILLDNQSEILEFEDKNEALKLCEILNVNSDSGHSYVIREV
jgi:hypothetical protein